MELIEEPARRTPVVAAAALGRRPAALDAGGLRRRLAADGVFFGAPGDRP